MRAAQSSGWGRTAAVAALLLAAAPLSPPSVGGKRGERPAGAWQVVVGSSDLSGLASPTCRGGALVLNVVALAPALGIDARVEGDRFTVVDRAGRAWQGASGASLLAAQGRTLPLAFPLQLRGGAAYLPVEAIAEIAGIAAEVDRAHSTITFGGPGFAADAVPDGWQALTIGKSASEKEAAEEHSGISGSPRAASYQAPPGHDAIRFGMGAGCVQGADVGFDLSASGRVRGVELEGGSLLTYGPRGLLPYSGRLSLRDHDGGWGMEAGDLYSEIWGLRRGVRYSWNAGKDRWPSVAFYARERRLQHTAGAFAYRDELRLTPKWLLGGEVATDGSFQARSSFQAGPVALAGYVRGDETPGRGVFVNWQVRNGVDLHGSASASRSAGVWSDVRSLGVRLPLWQEMDLTLEHTQTRTQGRRSLGYSALVSLPVGPLRLLTGFQLADDVGLVGTPAEVSGFRHRRGEWTTALGYSLDPRLRFDYQVKAQWAGEGSGRLWTQLVAGYQLSPRTQLQAVTGFPHVADAQQLHLRLEHYLGRELSLLVDYGRLAPYQPATRKAGSQGLMVMLRRHWDMPTPAGGGRIRGRVTDQTGRPVPGVVVRWNGYGAAADRNGSYVLDHLPSGSCRISLDPSSLPADYRVTDQEPDVGIAGRQTRRADFCLVPLDSIGGVVFCDRDGNGRWDTGEGIEGTVPLLDGVATAAGADGRFGFYNVEPGAHVVRLDAGRLPEGLAPAGPCEVKVDLQAGKPLSGVSFRLERREKAVVFQAIL